MTEQMIIAMATLAGLTILALTAMRCWQGWLALKERELERGPSRQRTTRASEETRIANRVPARTTTRLRPSATNRTVTDGSRTTSPRFPAGSRARSASA